jgi:hypothetical protein
LGGNVKKNALLLVIVTLVSLAAWACGGSSDESPTEATAVVEQGATEATTGKELGETVEQGGYSLTVVGVEDPATPGPRHNPAPGTRLIVIDIIVRNENGARKMKVETRNATLLDANGFKYVADTHAIDDVIERKELDVGDQVRGKVAFNIDEDATPAVFMFEFLFGNKVEVDLQ